MPYLNLDVDFFTNRKTIRLIARVGHAGPTHLQRLWAYAAKHHPATGILQGYLPEELDVMIAWSGEPGKCVSAMAEVGFLDVIEGGYKIHDWEEHAGHLLAFKQRSQAANKARWEKLKCSNNNQLSYKESLETDKESFSTPPTIPTIPTIPTKLSTRRQGLEDFQVTEEIRNWARKEFGVEIPDEVVREFKDHWRKEPGRKLRMDWDATFQVNVRKLVGWGMLKPKESKLSVSTGTCQERVKRGNFLKPCAAPSITVVKGRPLCQAHKEDYDQRNQ
jgi:hypothetical protein